MTAAPVGRAAIVVAHPDDEVIFFGGLAARLRAAGWQLDVVCVTGVFGSGYVTGIRRAELSRATWALGARARRLPLADRPGPLDEAALARAFAEKVHWDRLDRVYTHGVWGEYGHLHHVQVCRATHCHGSQVYSLAGPFVPEVSVVLTPEELERKRALAARSYPSQPFAVDLCTPTEHLVRLGRPAVDHLTAIAWAAATGTVAPWAPSRPAVDLPTVAAGAAAGDGHAVRLALLRPSGAAGQNGAGAPTSDFSK
jgi:hypothetical protein